MTAGQTAPPAEQQPAAASDGGERELARLRSEIGSLWQMLELILGTPNSSVVESAAKLRRMWQQQLQGHEGGEARTMDEKHRQLFLLQQQQQQQQQQQPQEAAPACVCIC